MFLQKSCCTYKPDGYIHINHAEGGEGIGKLYSLVSTEGWGVGACYRYISLHANT